MWLSYNSVARHTEVASTRTRESSVRKRPDDIRLGSRVPTENQRAVDSGEAGLLVATPLQQECYPFGFCQQLPCLGPHSAHVRVNWLLSTAQSFFSQRGVLRRAP